MLYFVQNLKLIVSWALFHTNKSFSPEVSAAVLNIFVSLEVSAVLDCSQLDFLSSRLFLNEIYNLPLVMTPTSLL